MDGWPCFTHFSLLCRTHKRCVTLYPLILMHRFWVTFIFNDFYFTAINYFTFSQIWWTSNSSPLRNHTFLCCHQLWASLNEFKESLISSGPFCKAFIASADNTEILADLKFWLVSVFIPSWIVSQLVTQPASANCARACLPEHSLHVWM